MKDVPRQLGHVTRADGEDEVTGSGGPGQRVGHVLEGAAHDDGPLPRQLAQGSGVDWMEWWQRGGFDHVERHDDRVLLFATRLSEGEHTFSYLVRATTAGTFQAGPTRAEEMYEPEVFGRTSTDLVTVQP